LKEGELKWRTQLLRFDIPHHEPRAEDDSAIPFRVQVDQNVDARQTVTILSGIEDTGSGYPPEFLAIPGVDPELHGFPVQGESVQLRSQPSVSQ
jgi:hypothetical protein